MGTPTIISPYMCNAIHSVVTKHPKSAIYCAGDLNLPDICWNSGSVSGHR